MSQSKRQAERQFRARKEAQNPHGKIKSLKRLAKEDVKE
ncbi:MULTISPECIES: DUF6254 family protein [Halalkalibacter]|jgi:hypothetical protein|uniref:DUF6254 family protein n=1 Tax=Halalkalibacter alkaliphilus TaxID=2917993 RepID=A0A9X2CR15_9BACI|nr:DUF6254 family protein [Halalkalibacter alkaliphilus]MCL7746606.1 DUF6254 family protein [Halalkalibacter alkaliphilus]